MYSQFIIYSLFLSLTAYVCMALLCLHGHIAFFRCTHLKPDVHVVQCWISHLAEWCRLAIFTYPLFHAHTHTDTHSRLESPLSCTSHSRLQMFMYLWHDKGIQMLSSFYLSDLCWENKTYTVPKNAIYVNYHVYTRSLVEMFFEICVGSSLVYTHTCTHMHTLVCKDGVIMWLKLPLWLNVNF